MPDTSPSEEQLESLRHRWNLEKTPRVLLQLADEYRKGARAAEAIPFLLEGLEVYPGHLSFRIAMGRCRLEMGDESAAIEILEAVTSTDPTQLVANKALLQAYIQAGQLANARERLLHYSLLASGDPDLESLEDAVKGLEGRAPDSPEAGGAEPVNEPSDQEPESGDPDESTEPMLALGDETEDSTPGALEDPFGSLGEATDAIEPRSGDEIFAPAVVEEAVASTAPAAEPGPADSAIENEPTALAESPRNQDMPMIEPEPARASAPTDDPFGLTGEDRHHWSRAIEAEGIFALDAPVPLAVSDSETPTRAVGAVEELGSQAALELAHEPEPEPEPDVESGLELGAETESPVVSGEQIEDTPAEQEPGEYLAEEPAELVDPSLEASEPIDLAPEAVDEPAEEVSATLGMLYLRQEHYGEARDIFSMVAQGQPAGSVAARRLELLRPVPDHPVTAKQLLAGSSSSGPNERKQDMIRAYLKQIRTRVPRRVS